MSKILMVTPIVSSELSSIFDEKTHIIKKATIISVDYPPLVIENRQNKNRHEAVFGKKTEEQVSMFDVAGLILDIEPINKVALEAQVLDEDKKIIDFNIKLFIVAKDLMFISQKEKKVIAINGEFDVLPDELISKIYVNFPDLKSLNLEELEDFLMISKDETAIKAFKKLGSYFTTKNYETNNNIFNLIEHEEQATAISKKVLLRKMVAWEIRK